MRAIVLDRPGSFRVAEVPDPTPGPGQVVVKVDACGICGTDLHIMDGEFPPTPYPITPAAVCPARPVPFPGSRRRVPGVAPPRRRLPAPHPGRLGAAATLIISSLHVFGNRKTVQSGLGNDWIA